MEWSIHCSHYIRLLVISYSQLCVHKEILLKSINLLQGMLYNIKLTTISLYCTQQIEPCMRNPPVWSTKMHKSIASGTTCSVAINFNVILNCMILHVLCDYINRLNKVLRSEHQNCANPNTEIISHAKLLQHFTQT